MGRHYTIVVVSEGAVSKDGTVVVKRQLDDGKGLFQHTKGNYCT